MIMGLQIISVGRKEFGMPVGSERYKTVDLQAVPRHFDSAAAEKRWHKFWQDEGIYRYDPTQDRRNTFVVDTPPPTVSGSLHIGHVFSYTHTDFVVRFQRMTGKNIFYPMGWDDNGLPTERRVQNYFHIQCDPALPYEKSIDVGQASSKQRKKPAQQVSRKNFIELCHRLTAEDERAFMDLWQRAGLSVDWQETYATIDDHSRTIAQLSYLDLYKKGHIYSAEAPSMWDVDFGTAVAQAEIEDREEHGAYYYVAFGVERTSDSFTVATTRPELLAACVGVTAHPDDSRYKNLFGKKAVTPLYNISVPIFPSELADPEKGTGILMVCTFGDSTDVDWWKERKLELRQIFGKNGRFNPVDFAGAEWPSGNPDLAKEFYSAIEGKSINAARKIVAEQLREPRGSSVPDGAITGAGAPLRREPEPITHPVKFFEKGSKPIEFVTSKQWFVRLLDKKDMLVEKGRQINWYPDYMRLRFENWTENLLYDWCISRQRFFGVSFPMWYPVGSSGDPDFDSPILADPGRLPVDPMIDVPDGYTESQRNAAGGFIGESDIFDTWFTSSMSPQVASKWLLNPERHHYLFPMDLRPQAHDIIRTWAFYTIVKAALHEDTVPWKSVAISGFIVDPDRKKMSKSKGNVVTPIEYLERYSADGVRYWAAQAAMGTDMVFEENQMKIGRRLVTKIYNAAKFVLSQNARAGEILCELDRGFIARIRTLIEHATTAFEHHEFSRVVGATENFFWHSFTDTYLELAKGRVTRGAAAENLDVAESPEERPGTSEGTQSAVAGLRAGLSILVRLFAPFLPYIAEEVWSWAFAEETGNGSIHRARWPTLAELENTPPPEYTGSFDTAISALGAINKHKTLSKMSAGAAIDCLTLSLHPETAKVLESVVEDVMAGARVAAYEVLEDDNLETGEFALSNVEFAPRNNAS